MSELDDLKRSGEAPEWMDEPSYRTLCGSYLLSGETPRGAWMRVSKSAAYYLKKPELAEKFFDIMWKNWLCLSSPALSNAGTNRGLTISCFGSHIADQTSDIWKKAQEVAILSKYGGGTATYWGDVRCKGSPISTGGTTEGIVPFLKVFDSTINAVSQGSVRRGSMAAYLPWDHGDAWDFLQVRKPHGDVNRQCLNIHQGICLDDSFFHKLEAGDKATIEFAQELYKTRMEKGEPYIFFTDNVRRNRPKAYVDLGLEVKTSQLCSEILLYTDPEHTFVCCLSSMNAARWDEWRDTDAVYLATWFLDAIMAEFLDKARKIPNFENAVRHAEKGRALGLGVLGFHTLLQEKGLAISDFGSNMLNKAIFKKMKEEATRASYDLAKEYGVPEWCKTTGMRNTHLLAVAPTATNSVISSGVSPGIEPFSSNAFAKKTAKGTFITYNPTLKKLLASKGKDTEDVWSKIVNDAGSVRSLDFLSDQEKRIFLTAFEIDQRDLIDLAADRQKYIDQGASNNLFFSADVDPQYFHEVHMRAWKKGITTLYYCRSSSVLKADISSRDGSCVVCEG